MGRYAQGANGYYVDTGEEARLDEILELAEALHDVAFVDLARTYVTFLISHWYKQGVDFGATVRTLRAMKEKTWLWNQGGMSIYRVVIDGLLDHIHSAGAYDWITLLEFAKSALEWTEADEEQLSAGLEYYRSDGVVDDRDSCTDVSDLEELRGSLKDLNDRFGVDFTQTIMLIESDMAEREDRTRDDDDEGGGFSSGFNSSQADPMTEDDVREMFKTLRE
jgi:hypothetical protein